MTFICVDRVILPGKSVFWFDFFGKAIGIIENKFGIKVGAIDSDFKAIDTQVNLFKITDKMRSKKLRSYLER